MALKKNRFLILVSLMITSIFGIVAVQAFWISSSWENKEEEFSLAVNQTLKSVAREIQNRELSDYISAYQKLIDSVGKPTESNFTDIFLFLDEDRPNNLSTFFAFGAGHLGGTNGLIELLRAEGYSVTPLKN